jgi:hypothetical protein
MAAPRTIVNLLTRNQNRMRRNSRDHRWVTADLDQYHGNDSGPGETARPRKQQPDSNSIAPLSMSFSETERTRERPELPVLQATVYNLSELRSLPNPYTRRPSVRSWSSSRPSVHFEDEDVSPKTAIPPGKPSLQSPVSPIHTHRPTRRDSPVSIIEQDFALKDKANRDSGATLFPYFPAEIKKPDAKAQKAKATQAPRGLADICRTAKAIYVVGPKGEGQKLWSSYKKSRNRKQDVNEVKQIPLKPQPTPRGRPYFPYPPARPPPSQATIAPRKPFVPEDSFRPRQDSDLSLSSCEVPVRIGSDVQRFVDAAKPLPSAPHIQPAPRAKHAGVDLSKPLPRVPLRAPPHKTPYVYVDPVKPLPPVPLFSGRPLAERKAADKTVSGAKSTKANKWWPSLPKTHAPKPHPHISRPRPITALEHGRTANVAVECGGVGGPGAKTPPARMSEKARGKQKVAGPGMEWTRRRKSSDVSFACQGVGEGTLRHVEGKGDGWRDTAFYRAYCEVLDEY